MRPIHRYLILSTYLILWVTIFWNMNSIVECSGILCALLPVLAIWILFIGSTILVFVLKPLKFKRVLIRFFVTAFVTIICYVIYYNSLNYQNFDYDFNDYVLPGIMLTIGFSLNWLFADYFSSFFARKMD